MLEINAEFESDYNNDEYEQKVASLVQNIEARDKAGDGIELERWNLAAEKPPGRPLPLDLPSTPISGIRSSQPGKGRDRWAISGV